MKKRIQKESRENKMSMSDNARKVWITFLYLFGAMVAVSFIVALSGLKMLSDNPAVFIVRMEMDNNTLKATEFAQQKVCQPVQCNCVGKTGWYDGDWNIYENSSLYGPNISIVYVDENYPKVQNIEVEKILDKKI